MLQAKLVTWYNLYLFVFSVTRRSRSDESHLLTNWVSVSIDFTDVTLVVVSDDTYRDFTDVILIALMTLLKVI